jgi:membrane-associated protein
MDVGPIIENISGAAYYALPIMALGANLLPGLPEEIFVIAVGYVSALGAFPFWLSFLLVLPALVLSDTMLFLLSRSGNKVVHKLAHKIFGDLATSHLDLVARRQIPLLVISRFVFQARFLGPFLCGVTRMNIKKFLFVDIIAVSVYVWTMFAIGLFIRQRFADVNDGAGLVIDILSVVALGVLLIFIVAIFKKRFVGWVRQLLTGNISFFGFSRIRTTDEKSQ